MNAKKKPLFNTPALHTTHREEWYSLLGEAIALDIVQPAAAAAGYDYPIPKMRFTVGYPANTRATSNWLGACHNRANSTDGTNEVFMTPLVDDVDTLAHVLTHEIIHAFDDGVSGHRAGQFFGKVARKAGLVGKLTATTASPELAILLKGYTDELGPLPAAKMVAGARTQPKQQGRHLNVCCTTCDFKFRTSRKWLDQLFGGADVSTCNLCGNETLTHNE